MSPPQFFGLDYAYHVAGTEAGPMYQKSLKLRPNSRHSRKRTMLTRACIAGANQDHREEALQFGGENTPPFRRYSK